MLKNVKNLFFDRKRSNEEYQVVLETVKKINMFTYNHSYAIFPWMERSKNFDELKKLPDIIYNLQKENESLKWEVKRYKEKAENVSEVVDIIIDTVEKRYVVAGGE